jgi:hypothetical protein
MLRKQIREWQPQLRMLFLTRITLFNYRLQLTGFELPERVRASQLEFDDRLAAYWKQWPSEWRKGRRRKVTIIRTNFSIRKRCSIVIAPKPLFN